MRRVGFSFVAAFLIGLSAAGRVAADEPNAAEQLFREGHVLLKAQRYSEACAKFAESERHDPASGTLLALAYCQELNNQLASAEASYLAAAGLARAENQGDRQRAAAERAESLSQRVSTLTVNVPQALWTLAGLRVTSNGAELAPSAWGRPFPVDGGNVEIQVAATNHQPWSTRLLLAPDRDQRAINVPVLLEDAPSTAPGPRAAAIAPSAPRVTESHYWSTPRVVGWTAVGTGALAGVATVYFTLAAKSAQSDVESALNAEKAAPANARIPWDASGHTREEDGRRAQALAQGFGIASAALLIGGSALVIFGTDKKDHEAPSLALGASAGAAHIQYATAF